MIRKAQGLLCLLLSSSGIPKVGLRLPLPSSQFLYYPPPTPASAILQFSQMKQQFQDTHLSLKRRKERENQSFGLFGPSWSSARDARSRAVLKTLRAAVAQTGWGEWLPGNHYGQLTCSASCLECGCCGQGDHRGHQGGPVGADSPSRWLLRGHSAGSAYLGCLLSVCYEHPWVQVSEGLWRGLQNQAWHPPTPRDI